MANPSPSLNNNKFLGLINKQKKVFTNAIDAVLADDGCTTACKLLFNELGCTECINCVFNPMSGRSAGVYKAGGPVPFGKGMICPICGGAGQVDISDEEEEYNLMVIFDSKKFTAFGRGQIEYRSPDNPKDPKMFAQTMCRIELYHKIKSAKFALLNTIMESYSTNKYERVGEPEPIGFGTPQYIITTWQLVEA